MRKRFSIAAGAASLLLLALPSLASANPGAGPELVQRSGRLVVVHADRANGTSTQQWTLVKGTTHLRVHAPDDVWITPGTPVRLEGTIVGGTLQLADSTTAVTETGTAPMLAASSGTAASPAMQSTAVILFGFSGGPTGAAMSPTMTRQLVFDDPSSSLNAYYQEQTYGQIGFSGAVYGPFDLTQGTGTCSQTDNYSWATEAIAHTGLGTSSYQHFVFVFPLVAGCNWSGQAEIGGKYVWINGPLSVTVLAHELGHNLGLSHAGGLYCTSGATAVSVGGSCPNAALQYPYGDPFDAMGRSDPLRQMSMEHKLALNLLPASAVKTVGGPGTYRISPMETLTGAPELLRIPKPGGGNYYVEYRQPIGFFDSQSPLLQGVLLRTEAPSSTDGNRADTLLIDMHPGTPHDWSDAAMDVSQVFSDPLTGISIEDVSQDATGATLQVNAPHDSVPPSAVGGLTATPNGTSAVLHWTAATDDYAVDSYVITRDGASIASTPATDFQDSNLVPGTTVAYTVAAVDAGGNVGPATAASVVMPDTIAPNAPARVTARLTKDGQVHLSWTAATDNGRIAEYRVLRGGNTIASGNSTVYVDKSARPGGGSTVTYSVVAVDLAGNVGAPGKAAPLRAALLRKLTGSSLKATRLAIGKHLLVRVTGKVSDPKARCRVRLGVGSWHACRAKVSGAFDVSLPARGTQPVVLSLRDVLGRVKTQTLRVR